MFKHGILGIRVRFERHMMDNAMNAVTSGTSLLNHTIKNEILKINYCLDFIKKHSDNDPQLDEYIGVMSTSANHLLEMIKKIKTQIDQVIIKKKPNDLIGIVEAGLISYNQEISNKEIRVIKSYNPDDELIISCDQIHIQGVINNIIQNAIEAMDGEESKTLHIDILQNKKYVDILIKDNGEGISKEDLTHIYDPFFSTKRSTQNFGLGLTYCYNVIQQHNGSIEISSVKKVGTIVYLKLPKVKFCLERKE